MNIRPWVAPIAISLLAAVTIALPLGGRALAQPHSGGMPGAPLGPSLAPASIDSSLDVGSVRVTVVAGALEKPLANVSVTIAGKNNDTTKKTARSDASGVVTFGGLAEGPYEVSATPEGAATLKSELFAVSTSGGVVVLLTTVPIGPGRGGRPSTRMMSGRSRAEQNDPAGQLTIRAIAGELAQSKFGGLTADIPAGAIIHMVGMHADGTMTVDSKEVIEELEGRVVYDELVSDNSVAYYAMTLFERAGGTDRLMAEVLRMPPRVGSRMMFAGAPTKSAAAGIDDLGKLTGTGEAAPGPGIVDVMLYSENSQSDYFNKTSEIELVQVGSKEKPRSAATFAAPPSTATVMAQAGSMKAMSSTAAGQVSFYAARPSTKSDLADVKIVVQRAQAVANHSDAQGQTAQGEVVVLKTDAKGLCVAEGLVPGVQYVAVASLYGKETRTDAFTPLADKPLSFAFAFEWQEPYAKMVSFGDVPSGASYVYVARATAKDRTFYSLPFQITKERGASVGIYMFPELLFSMHGGAELDDSRLWFQSRFSIANPGVIPFRSSAQGARIPLPKGFLGASVADEMTFRVGVESDQGFLWRGAVPPGQRDFIASFALDVQDGGIKFDMELPYGLRGGRMVVEDMPGMKLLLPPGSKAQSMTQPNGRKFLEMPDIEMEAGKRLVFALRGMPQHSAWGYRFQIIVGGIAVLFVLWGLVVVFFGGRSEREKDPQIVKFEAKREQLMTKLVNLEMEQRHRGGGGSKDAGSDNSGSDNSGGDHSNNKYSQTRDKLKDQLAEVYSQIDECNAASAIKSEALIAKH